MISRTRALTSAVVTALVGGALAPGWSTPAVAAADPGLFHPYVQSDPTAGGARAANVAMGDVTGDGRVDVVMTTGYGSDPATAYSVWVYRQQATGGIDAPVQLPTGAAYGSEMSVALADLDNDGDLDAAVGTMAGVRLYQQTSAGLVYSWTVPVSDARDLELTDVSGDGLADLVVNSKNGVFVWRQVQGDMMPLVQGALTGPGVTEVETGDVTGDRRADVVIARGGSVQVYQLSSDGAVSGPATYDATGTTTASYINGIAISDVDVDGRLDVSASVGGNRPGSFVNTLFQKSDGTLGSVFTRASYDVPETLEAADVTRDGRPDLVVLHGGWNAMGVYDSQPGTAPTETLYSLPYASHYPVKDLALGDVSGDGVYDVAVADYNNGLVILWGNGTPPPADTTPPTTSITSGPEQTIYSSSTGVMFTASEPSTFRCSLDAGAWTPCSSPATFTNLTAGQHRIQVRATDLAGNVETIPTAVSFAVIAADTAITSGPSGSVRATSASFDFSANRNGTTFQCAFDATTFTACSSPATYAGLAPGSSHTFSVRAVAQDGLTDPTPASRTFSIDPQADLGVTTVATPTPVKKNTTVTWTSQVSNAGPGTATGVTLAQTLPAGVTFLSAAVGSSTSLCGSSSNTVRCNVPNLAAGATATVTVRGTVTVPNGVLGSTTSVATSAWDPVTGNNTAITSTKVGNGK